jgi:hypothetical protein
MSYCPKEKRAAMSAQLQSYRIIAEERNEYVSDTLTGKIKA